MCQVFHVHKRWKRKNGKKQEINSSEANTIPNSQCNINFGWWLAFISFCLDEQICYKINTPTYGSWLHCLLAQSELLSLTRKTNIFFLNHSLAKFPLKKVTVENIHHKSRFCQFGFTGKEITTFIAVCISEELMRR